MNFFKPGWTPLVAVLAAVLLSGQCAFGLEKSITDYGAVAGDERLDTQSIQQAIDDISQSGGGRLVVPEGVFSSGALDLKHGVNIHLAAGAVLRGSANIADFPTRMTRIEGKVQPWRPALLNAKDLTRVRITGPGTLDGNGKPYWRAFWKRRAENPKCTNLEVERPRLLYLENCDDVAVKDLRLKDSGFWNLHVYRCRNVRLEGITITAPHGDPPRITGDNQPWDEVSVDRAPSSDGIDIDSSQDVTIRGCTISVGDDCIALKGTKGPLAMEDESSPPVQNILVEGCTFDSGHGMLTCGSEATIIRNVVVRNCQVGASVPVVRLKLRPDTPQIYENFVFEDLMLDGAQALFDVKPWTQFFDLGGHEPPKSVVRNVIVRNVRGTLRSLGDLRGNPGDEIENVVVQQSDLKVDATRLRVGDDAGLHWQEVTVNEKAYAPKTGGE